MTYLAPAATPTAFGAYLRSVRPAPVVRPATAISGGQEDTARRALGIDAKLPAAVVAGASMERLARIALG